MARRLRTPIWLLRAPPSSGSYTLTAEAGVFTLTGQAAGLRVARSIGGAAGSFALTGQDAGLRLGRRIVAEAGLLTLSGQSAGLVVLRRLGADAGSFALGGQAAGLSVARLLTAEAGVFTFTGQAVGLSRTAGYLLTAEAGVFVVTGQAATLRAARLLDADVGSFALTGQAATLTRSGITETPVRTAILDAVVTALTTAAITIRGTAVTIERSRTDMIEEAERPLLAVVAGDMDILAEAGDALYRRYRQRVILAGYLAGASEQDAEEDAAELHAKAIRALIRPDPNALPVSLMLADNVTEVWIEEGALRVEPASVTQSETPAATCVIELFADVRQPWGNLFIAA